MSRLIEQKFALIKTHTRSAPDMIAYFALLLLLFLSLFSVVIIYLLFHSTFWG